MSRITRKSLATRIKVGYLTRIAIDHPWANQNNVDLTPINLSVELDARLFDDLSPAGFF
jgi:hypothetical protein